MQPGDPPNARTWVSDLSSKTLANKRRAIRDNFTKNLFERPFTSQDMEYQPYLDINRVDLAYADPWFYFTIFLEGAPPDASSAAYAIEVDLDQDGRGDWFITAQTPPDSQWTTAGVQVWRDSNNDVGGPLPSTPNPHPQAWMATTSLSSNRVLALILTSPGFVATPTQPAVSNSLSSPARSVPHPNFSGEVGVTRACANLPGWITTTTSP